MHTEREPIDDEQVATALAEVDALRRRVLNVVGHSLRTPVTTISGMAAALQDTADEDQRAALVEGLARNARRLEALVDSLLLAVGVTTAAPVDDPAPTSVRRAVLEAWQRVGDGEHLHVAGPDVTARLHAGAGEKILELVLDNARKYGDGPVTVTIEAHDDTRSAVVLVAAPGEAPSEEELEHAFELMYRGEHAVMASSGIGVGLFAARQLSRIEGGDVTMTSAGGAVVATVALPV